MGQMHVMGQRGDTAVAWDETKLDEVEAARATFEGLLTGKGYLAFSVESEENKQIRTFDPNAEKIILVPPVAGG